MAVAMAVVATAVAADLLVVPLAPWEDTTAEEGVEVQGMAIFVPDNFEYPYPFRDVILASTSPSKELRSMSGNMPR